MITSPSVHKTALHGAVTFLREDRALKASDSQRKEENAKVSTHQLIIHDAFKKPVLQLCVAMATAGSAAIQCWHTTFGCDSVRGKLAFAVADEDHHGAEKYFLWLRIWWRCHVWQEQCMCARTQMCVQIHACRRAVASIHTVHVSTFGCSGMRAFCKSTTHVLVLIFKVAPGLDYC